MPTLARYRPADWHQDAGPEDEWLAAWARAGWVPDEGVADGVWVIVGGVQRKRWRMRRVRPTLGASQVGHHPA